MTAKPPQKGKHFLSSEPPAQNGKRRRTGFFTESPDGSMRESSALEDDRLPSVRPVITNTKSKNPKKRSGDASKLSIDPEGSLKKPESKKSKRALRSGRDDLMKMPVREIIRQGIATAKAREQAHRQHFLETHHEDAKCLLNRPTNSISTVGGWQRFLDYKMHVNPQLGPAESAQEVNTAYGTHGRMSSNIVPACSHHLVDLQQEKKQFMDHLGARRPHVSNTSERLQAALGVVNRYPFLLGQRQYRAPEIVMEVEQQHQLADPIATSGLLDHLIDAGRKYGYRQLELEHIRFSRITMTTEDDGLVPNGEAEGSEVPEKHQCSAEMELDATDGSIMLYETTIPQESGPPTTWMWFKITKPLVCITGRRPQEFWDATESWVVFAIPKLQVETIREALDHPDTSAAPTSVDSLPPLRPQTRHGLSAFTSVPDFASFNLQVADETKRKLNLSLRFSKYGVPSFACSAKPEFLREKGFVEDFLYVDNVPGMPRKASEAVQGQWWNTLRYHANMNKVQWERVQEGMARYASLVEVRSKPGQGWVDVAPERVAVRSKTKGTASFGRDAGFGSAKKDKEAGKRRSGLRYEMSLD